MPRVVVRDARADDVARVAEIYAHYVLHSVVTFEESVPAVDEMLRRWRAVLQAGHPYIVAELVHADGDAADDADAVESGGARAHALPRVIGYAYYAQFRDRIAYRFTVENAVYVAHDVQPARRGIGRALMSELLARAERAGVRQMLAVMTADNEASRGLHAALGFTDCGVLAQTGWKFGRWIDVLIMQRAIGDGGRSAPAELKRPDQP